MENWKQIHWKYYNMGTVNLYNIIGISFKIEEIYKEFSDN